MSVLHEKECPICNSELIVINYSKSYDAKDIFCPNKCYTYIKLNTIDRRYNSIYIFDKHFLISLKERYRNSVYEQEELDAQKEIDYWKENDRYLMKLIGGN